jgi:hypothetical protein
MTDDAHLKAMKEQMEAAKRIPYMDGFRAHMMGMHGYVDEDFERLVPVIRSKVLCSEETDPVAMFERILAEMSPEWKKGNLPVHADFHHFLVPGVLVASLRNSGGAIVDMDVEEAMRRGEKFMGGSCGFAGTCGGAYSVGIALSIAKKTTPLHEEGRSVVMRAVAETLGEIAKHPKRCCKRSSYAAMETGVRKLNEMGYNIPTSVIACRWSSKNKMCMGTRCPYFDKARVKK